MKITLRHVLIGAAIVAASALLAYFIFRPKKTAETNGATETKVTPLPQAANQ